ncbi:hypothetical protein ACFWZW_03485 [Microbacterium enclense]|uniref:hypothetical protein n=1 Tax=Microbacterium enclense TaxID=993073 RepID=UPI0036DC97E3
MKIELPATVMNGGSRGLVAVPPRIQAARAEAHPVHVAVGERDWWLPRGWEVSEGRVGDVAIAFAMSRDARRIILLVETANGVRQVLGHGAAFYDAVRRDRFGVGADGVVGDARAAAARGDLS